MLLDIRKFFVTFRNFCDVLNVVKNFVTVLLIQERYYESVSWK